MISHQCRRPAAALLALAISSIGPAHGQTMADGDQAPASEAPSAPAAYLGHPVGMDFKLAGWDTITGYFDRLATTSPYIRIDTLGATTQGRPFILATITAADRMDRLDDVRSAQAKLADPRELDRDELERLAATQPVVVLIAHNIHSTEIASSQGVMQLAYDLVTDPELVDLLDRVVVLLIPSVNPDGQQLVVDWYRRTVGTPYEGSGMPWLYHPYVGHDNNRDFFMLTQVESRMLNDVLYELWYPEVVYDVHQMGNRGARLFVPPFDDPPNPNIDPLIVREISLFGIQISTDLEAAGKSGVVNGERFDLWWHGGLRTAPARHNMVGILSETASARLASPVFQEPEEREPAPQIRVRYPNPWPGGWWHLSDIIDYQLIAARSLIGLAARQRERLIRNFVEVGRRAIEAGRQQPPFAYVIPARQRDPGSAATMLEILQRGGVEVHRASAPFTADGLSHEAGDWVILMAQPYRAHAKDLLERQSYPDLRVYPEGPPDTPYDAAGWTLPLQMGVEAVEVVQPFEADLQPADAAIRPAAGSISGYGDAYVLDNRTNAANLAVHRTIAGGGVAVLSTGSPGTPGDQAAAGSVVLSGPTVGELLRDLADSAGLSARAFSANTLEGYRLDRLRVGLYQPWTASMDEGWTRYVFDTWELPYSTVHDAAIRAGDLRERFDVLILPDLSPGSIVDGRKQGTVPSEYAGGLGRAGVDAIRRFVDAGGTLICLDASSDFAIEQLDLPVTNVRPSFNEQRTGKGFYAPGSILAVELDTTHPLAYGMPERSVIYYSNSAIFEVQDGASEAAVIAEYPDAGQLLSGYAINSDYLAGKAALVEVAAGEGRVILFGFRPQHRGQTHETFKLLFNAVYRGAARGPERVEF